MLSPIARNCAISLLRICMHATNKTATTSTRLALGILTGAMLSASGFAATEHKSLTRITEAQWASRSIQKAPELQWLKSAEAHKTEEGVPNAKASLSEQLFGKQFVELDRTMMTLRCLRLILDGGPIAYKEFTEVQPEKVKLSWASFVALHQQLENVLESGWGYLTRNEMAEAMEVALVLGDMGKSNQARDVFRPYGVGAADHDDFYGEAMQCLQSYPELCPSFAVLSPASKQLLQLAAQVGHFGHMTHLEGTEEMFAPFKQADLMPLGPRVCMGSAFV